MKDMELGEMPTINEALSQEHGKAARQSLQLDVAYYQELFDDPDLSETEKEQIITALWSIVVAFVELGFGVHPAQQACGQNGTNGDQSSNSSSDSLDWEGSEKTNINSDTPEP